MTNPPKKKPATQIPETPVLVFATIFAYVFPPEKKSSKKGQGYGALEEGSLRGIMALDLYHFTGAQGNGQVAMRRTSVRWVEDGDGGGCIVFFLLHFFFKTEGQKLIFKTKTQEGTHKEGRNFQS